MSDNIHIKFKEENIHFKFKEFLGTTKGPTGDRGPTGPTLVEDFEYQCFVLE
jgi:hypothetical protein